MARAASNNGRLIHFKILLLMCALLIHSSLAIVDGRTGGSTWLVADVKSLFRRPVCSPPKETNSKRLTITHRSSPCSPLSADFKLNHAQIMKNDQVRVNSIQRRIRGGKSISVIVPAKPGLSLDIGNYVVRISLGTPMKNFLVAIDTGSDLSWINCSPCFTCHEKPATLYNPTRSRTHTDILCNSTECSLVDSHTCSPYKRCKYDVLYGDTSQTNGYLVRDTLFLSKFDTLRNFIFGCGNNNTGLFGKVSGLIGLGRDNISLASQASSKYAATFSYCLPSATSTKNGYLLFGENTLPNMKFTPMIKKPSNPSFYYLNLITILVGNYPLDVPSTVFKYPGMVIDSGTVITRLPLVAYNKFKTQFRYIMDKNYTRSPPFDILDTCYNMTGLDNITIPTVSLVFSGGAALYLDLPGILYTPDPSLTCLAFANTSGVGDVGIIGNTQQQTFDVAYDIANKMIGFSPGGCA